jgi:transposase
MPQNSQLNAPKKQRGHYSGKKKCHTQKAQVIAEMTTGNILSANFCAGRKHDFQLFKETGFSLPPHLLLLADAGYQGVAKIHPNSQKPFKKTKLHPLNKEQKASNQTLSRKRILIEHIFRRLKVFRILNERYRNRRKRFGLRFSLIAAVYNMELKIADGLLMQEV